MTTSPNSFLLLIIGLAMVSTLIFFFFTKFYDPNCACSLMMAQNIDGDAYSAFEVQKINKEFDDQILRTIYRDQQQRRQQRVTRPDMNFKLLTVIPEVSCGTALVRLGSVEDGGKWMCRPWRAPTGCIVYSLGVGGDASFESDVGKYTNCTMYSFDPGPFEQLFQKNSSRHIYKPWYITTEESSPEPDRYNVFDIMEHFGHTKIDILKMDIERTEYKAIPQLFNSTTTAVKVCHLLLEMHGQKIDPWLDLLRIVEKNDFLLYGVEPNCWDDKMGGKYFEYSFIHRSCMEAYGFDSLILHRNFAGTGK